LATHFFRFHDLFALYPEHKNSENEEIKNNYKTKSKELEIIIADCRQKVDIFFKKCKKIS